MVGEILMDKQIKNSFNISSTANVIEIPFFSTTLTTQTYPCLFDLKIINSFIIKLKNKNLVDIISKYELQNKLALLFIPFNFKQLFLVLDYSLNTR